ncbi:hypothetical protein H257_18620 [Aphanomyces astaci]|uniref:subtilisin n=1 Tax=Aphanomyces astaci TaxID=112090 RepID=W4FAL9_APHAT|nr:hypothetical protein H257_18620 [Aphanomyces astaci]ETV64502.1 hypothetical protein H257_18620 [Aphanomyces astaci]|eukprot:XP_009846017.1 hypothetical protein H257_18620 [Aphanomyces astaci]
MALTATAATAKISVQVHRNLEIAKQSNIVVKFYCDEALTTHHRRLKGGAKASRTETIESLVNSLKEHTTTSQASVKSLLANQVESTAVAVATTWIQCSMYINNAPTDLVHKFAALPEVKSIYEAVMMELSQTKSDDKPASAANDIKGEGIVVANIDTGVHHIHESLESNWRREYGWFNPYNKTNQLPSDTDGHSTHAKWIACKGCEDRMVVQCDHFLLCPHDKDGNNCDSSKAPHVINDSFGEHRTDNVKRSGNHSRVCEWQQRLKGCAYSSYPAACPQVITVGSTNSGDFLAFDSSLGPSVRKRGKPDISAPGVSIHSAVHFSDNGFIRESGTSMAAPHVSGAIALYLSANNGASYDQAYAALTENVDTDTLYPPNKTCGGITNTKYPNKLFGFGRLNI